MLAAGRDKGIGFLQGNVQRLLANDVLAGLRRLDAQFGVGAGRRADIHHLNGIVGEQFRHGAVGGDIVFIREANRKLRLHVADADQFRSGGVLDGLRVGAGNAPRADHAKANCLLCSHALPSLLLLTRVLRSRRGAL